MSADHESRTTETSPGKPRVRWWHRPMGLIVLFCCVGPLMLPLVWWNPILSRRTKLLWTLVVLGITWLLFQGAVETWRNAQSAWEQLQAM